MMGGGAGAILAMIESYKNNAALRRKRSILKRDRSPFAAQKQFFKPSKGYINTRPLTDEELADVKARFAQVRRKSRIRTAIAGGIVLALTTVLVFVAAYSFDSVANGLTPEQVKEKYVQRQKFAFFINDGDKYFEQGHWHNAKFQYDKALEIYPQHFDAQYRYCLVLNYRCAYEQIDCEEADEVMAELLDKYPDNEQVLKLANAQFTVVGEANAARKNMYLPNE